MILNARYIFLLSISIYSLIKLLYSFRNAYIDSFMFSKYLFLNKAKLLTMRSTRIVLNTFQTTTQQLELNENIDSLIKKSPIIANIYVDTEILQYLNMKNNERKTRMILSSKSNHTIPLLKEQIEKRLVLLSKQPYKLRYKLTSQRDVNPKLLNQDEDLIEVLNSAHDNKSSLQLYVQVTPGIFPPIDALKGSAGFINMRKLHVDPSESDGYTMVSFYSFNNIQNDDVVEFSNELKDLWQPFQALGRIYVAAEGVNAQMAIPSNVLTQFQEATFALPLFRNARLNVDHNVSRSDYEIKKPFKSLHIRVRDQIVADGLSEPLDWSKAGKEMEPLEWHQQLNTKIDTNNTIVLDCRNSYESDVGLFENAIPLNTTFFRDSWAVLDDLLKDKPKDSHILTYCTGGIRCVKVNAYLQQKLGFTNTHRLKGGIISYTRELDNSNKEKLSTEEDADIPASNNFSSSNHLQRLNSKFRGVNYVFDERIAARITEDVLGQCEQCAAICDTYNNCPNHSCNVRFIQCSKCSVIYRGCCSKACSIECDVGKAASVMSQSKQNLLSRQATRIAVQHNKNKNNRISSTADNSDSTVSSRSSSSTVSLDSIESKSENSSIENKDAKSEVVKDHAYAWDAAVEALMRYCERHTTEEPPLLIALREETERKYTPGAARMISGALQGRILAMIVSLSNAKDILELGTFTGYSAICLAQGLDKNVKRNVVTCEPDPISANLAQQFFEKCGLTEQIDLRRMKAMDLINELRNDPNKPLFDIVFIDADKKHYSEYLAALMGDHLVGEWSESNLPIHNIDSRPLIRDGALIIVDNTLWKGLVLNKCKDLSHLAPDPQSYGAINRMQALADSMHSFNNFAFSDSRLQPVMLPLRDGITFIRYSNEKNK